MVARIPGRRHPRRRAALPPGQLVPGRAGIAAQRAAHLHLGGGAAEVEVPLREQGGDLAGIDAARCIAGVLSVIESAAATDPEIADLWRELQDQRLRGMTMAARAFREQGALRPGLSVGRAADILWLYAGPWAYRSFVTDRGWSPDEYETWIGDTLYTQLMSPGRLDPPPSP